MLIQPTTLRIIISSFLLKTLKPLFGWKAIECFHSRLMKKASMFSEKWFLKNSKSIISTSLMGMPGINYEHWLTRYIHTNG